MAKCDHGQPLRTKNMCQRPDQLQGCAGIPKLSIPSREQRSNWTKGKIQKDLNPIAGKGSMIPRLVTRQTCPHVKSQPAQVEKQLKNGHWQCSATNGENKQPTTKTQNN